MTKTSQPAPKQPDSKPAKSAPSPNTSAMPPANTTTRLLALQSQVGNQAVQRMFRRKTLQQAITLNPAAPNVQLTRGKINQTMIFNGKNWDYDWAVVKDEDDLDGVALVYDEDDAALLKSGAEIEYDIVGGKYVLNVEKTREIAKTAPAEKPAVPPTTKTQTSTPYTSTQTNTPAPANLPTDPDGQLPPTQQGKGELQEYAKHYREARLFHGTESHNVENIDKGGLKTEFAGTGKDTERDDRRGKVFLGRDAETSRAYASNNTANMGRVMLPPNRTVWNDDPRTAEKHETFSQVEHPEQLWTDPRMGPAAFVTGQDVPPEQVYFGKNSQLIDSPKGEGILKVVQQHYDPQGEVPSIDQLRQLHQVAVDEGYISDDPGDEHSKAHTPKKAAKKKPN